MNNSSLALSYFEQAATFYRQSRYVEAIQHYLLGLKYDTSRYYIYADLAKAYEMVGKWEQALAYLDIALRLCPDSPTVLRRKARINAEKEFYRNVIREIDFVADPPSSFAPTFQSDDLSRPRQIVEQQFFILTVDPAVQPKTLWYIYQLIEKTYNEVGEKLDRYPNHQITISIRNTNAVPPQADIPDWASGCYDGHIHLNYCADGEPQLGILYVLMRHEWTHLLIDLITQGNCPIWLNEGLAQTIARPLLSFEKAALKQAEKDRTLPVLTELNRPFAALSTSQRKIAYLQSAAIVADLIEQSSFSSIRQLLCLLGNNTPIEAALQQTFKKGIIPNL